MIKTLLVSNSNMIAFLNSSFLVNIQKKVFNLFSPVVFISFFDKDKSRKTETIYSTLIFFVMIHGYIFSNFYRGVT